jgi:hypothetical protein
MGPLVYLKNHLSECVGAARLRPIFYKQSGNQSDQIGQIFANGVDYFLMAFFNL